MPPARKKGANNKISAVGELQLGDLVLAKVKGFPAWPAKVSRPEDWERASDPKKYFVQFFGTQEIAFVAPADIQAFTSESKSKLLSRCKGKTVKFFAQAVKEICAAFEELQKHDDSRITLGHDAFNLKDGQNNGSHSELMKSPKTEKLCLSGDEVDCASVMGDSSVAGDNQTAAVKESIGQLHEMINRSKGSDKCSSGHVPKSFTAPSHSPLVKEEKMSSEERTATAHCERIESSRASSASSHSSDSSIERDANYHGSGTKDTNVVVASAVPLKFPMGEDKKKGSMDKSKSLISGAKRKAEPVTSHANDPRTGGKAGASSKVSAGGNAKRSASDVRKSELNPQGRDSKSLLKGSGFLDAAKNSPQNSEKRVDSEHLKQKNGHAVHELSQSVKKAKLVDRITDAAKGSVVKNGKSDVKSELLVEEAIPPVAKRRRHAVETMPNDDIRGASIGSMKADLPKKRRAVRLCDDDDEDEPKTPVHGGSAKPASKGITPGFIPHSTNQINQNHESVHCGAKNLKAVGRDGGSVNDQSSVKAVGELSIVSPPPKFDSSIKASVSHIPGPEAMVKRLVKESKQDLVSPIKSPQVVATLKKSAEQQKSIRPFNKGSNSATHSKTQDVSGKDSILASGVSNSSQSHLSALNRRPTSGERSKVLPKTGARLIDPVTSLDNPRDHDSVSSGRLEEGRDKSGISLDSKTPDSAFSMKNLIAAAQAKRRQAHMQNVPSGNEDSVLAPHVLVRSPSPPSAGHVLPSSGGNVTQVDVQGGHTRGLLTPPSGPGRQLVMEEPLDKGLSLGHQSVGSTFSGGTEAAVARDAFEGMIETLSRTKESIGRATRLAIDCAKYGIASEVVELLIRKLENESSFHRRVDLFFLVDSITQCSHGQKGIAGASYIPTVQSALPRLLGAAAPSGPNARENRRQCLKVLRLWLERKILPESVLRRFMDDIGSSNDDTISGVSFKRPSRAERSVDDPIREMEGMLVDEYGSNATFNLPGFLSTHGFVDDEDEDDISNSPINQSDASPLRPSVNASIGQEAGKVTPSDRRHHILEDVDGELEMEDVSGHLKDGTLYPTGLSEEDDHEIHLDTEFDPSVGNITETLSWEGSPPLPPESPPPLPPLPSSPPPPLLPPLPLSPSPPPPPPPPSAVLSQPALPTLLPPGPTNAGSHQPGIPLVPMVTPQLLLRPPAVLTSVQMAGSTSQQVPCFVAAGSSGSRQLEYGQGDIYTASQVGPSNQQFQQPQQFHPSQASFSQRPYQPVTLPQHPPGLYVYNKPTAPQHMPHPHSHPPAPNPPPSRTYPSSTEGLRRVGDEQWRSNPAEYNADNHHNTWVNGGRTQSCPAPNFINEAYFRPPERAQSDNLGYHAPAPNSAIPVPSASGHNMNQMLPSMPDRSSLNCWRPM